MPSLLTRTVTTAAAPARLSAEVALALPAVVAELPGLLRNVSVLVGELAKLSRDAPHGALTDLVENLARLTDEDGELTVLLREQAGVVAARAGEAAAQAPAVRRPDAGAARPGRSGRSSGASRYS